MGGEVENWLYDDGEDASKDDYNAKLQNLKEKANDFLSWAKLIKNKMEQEKRHLQQQEELKRRPQSSHGQSRQIPVVFENVDPFSQARSTSAGTSRSRNFQHPSQHDFRRYMMDIHFMADNHSLVALFLDMDGKEEIFNFNYCTYSIKIF